MRNHTLRIDADGASIRPIMSLGMGVGMKSFVILGVVLSVATAGIMPALGDEAGAVALQKTLRSYFGDMVSVRAKGDGYATVFDIASLFAGGNAPVRMTPLNVYFAPTPDGRWTVQYSGDVSLRMDVPNGPAMSYEMKGYSGKFVFDPALKAFVSGTGHMQSMISDSLSRSPTGGVKHTVRQVKDVDGEFTGGPGADGGVDGVATTVDGGWKMRIESSGIGADVTWKQAKSRLSIKGGMNGPILDLWAYSVAHLRSGASDADPGEVNKLLTAALPVFGSVDLSGEADGMKAAFNGGSATLDNLKVEAHTTGLVKAGAAGIKLSVDGLSIHSGAVSDWLRDAIPTDMELDADVSGVDGADGVRKFLELAPFGRSTPLDDDESQAVRDVMLPDGGVRLRMRENRLKSRDYEILIEGDVDLANGSVVGSALCKASGVDATYDALSKAAAAGDPMAQQAAIELALLKGLGDRDAHGLYNWVVKFSPDGILVNGKPMGRLPIK